MTRAIEELRRAVERDPEDHGAAHALSVQRAHLEGPGVYLEPLMDRVAWNATPEAIQDLSVEEVRRRLGDGVELVGMRVWSCDNKPTPRHEHDCVDCGYGGRGHRMGCKRRDRLPVSHRLATFRHRATGMELSLLPGMDEFYVCKACKSIGYTAVCRCGAAAGFEPLAPFLMGRWPVTFGQALAGQEEPRATAEVRENPELPAVNLSHARVAAWCKRNGLTLPSAAQWGHACRAGTATRFYWGDEMSDAHCWHAENSGGVEGLRAAGQITHIRERRPRPHAPAEHDRASAHNAFGLVDMVGNVGVWLSDPAPWGVEGVPQGLAVGGTYNISPLLMASFLRPMPLAEQDALAGVGFRAALKIPGL